MNADKKAEKKEWHIAVRMGVGIGLILIIAAGIFYSIKAYGKSSLLSSEDSPWSWANNNELGDVVAFTKDGTDYYCRTDVLNILCLGIDKEGEMNGPDNSGNSRGQADAIFLVSLDLTDKDIRIIAIPRDTIVMLKMYDTMGLYGGTMEGQIALQYAYGDGMLQSGQLMTDQVSDILDVHIHAFAALDLECIEILNDAIGGVDITMNDDYTMLDEAFVQGETVHLEGEQTMHFVRNRDTEVPGSAYTRLTRQKLYLTSFAEQAKKAIREDMTLPAVILDELRDYLVTSMNTAQMLYLAAELLDFDFAEEHMYVLSGEITSDGRHESFWPDEEALAELKIQLFYRQ